MDIRNSKALCSDAKQALTAQNFDPRKLALLHTGVAALFSLLLTALNFLISKQMDNAVGLSGVGLRSILTTAQSVLSIASFAIIPFWEMGFTAAGLRFARQEQAGPSTLLTGFHRWGGVLRLTLLRFAVYVAVMLACVQVASIIYAITPFSAPLMEAMLSVMESGAVLDEAAMQALLPSMIPLYVILLIVLLLALIPVLYRLRMASFALLDGERAAALPAMVRSWRLMRKNSMSLFRLDLRLWSYYVLSVLASVIGYGDVIASYLGIALPIHADAAFFLFYFLHILCQLGIAWLFGSRVTATYATAYDILLSEQTPPAENLLPEQ